MFTVNKYSVTFVLSVYQLKALLGKLCRLYLVPRTYSYMQASVGSTLIKYLNIYHAN